MNGKWLIWIFSALILISATNCQDEPAAEEPAGEEPAPAGEEPAPAEGETVGEEEPPAEPAAGEETPPEEPEAGEEAPPEEPEAAEETPPEEPEAEEETPPEEPEAEEETPPEEPAGGEETPPKEPEAGEETPPEEPEAEDETPPEEPEPAGGEETPPEEQPTEEGGEETAPAEPPQEEEPAEPPAEEVATEEQTTEAPEEVITSDEEGEGDAEIVEGTDGETPAETGEEEQEGGEQVIEDSIVPEEGDAACENDECLPPKEDEPGEGTEQQEVVEESIVAEHVEPLCTDGEGEGCVPLAEGDGEGGEAEGEATEVVEEEIVAEHVEPLCTDGEGEGCVPPAEGDGEGTEEGAEEGKTEGDNVDIAGIESQIVEETPGEEEVDVETEETETDGETATEEQPVEEEVIVPENVDALGGAIGAEGEAAETEGDADEVSEVDVDVKDEQDGENVGDNGEQQEVVEPNNEPTEEEAQPDETDVVVEPESTSQATTQAPTPTTTLIVTTTTTTATTTTGATEPVDNDINETKDNKDVVVENEPETGESEDAGREEEPNIQPVIIEESTTTTTTTTTPGPTYPPGDSCGNFTMLAQDNRYYQHTANGEYLSDKDLEEGWYGFTYQGKPAVASTDCVKEEHCGTKMPYYIKLNGDTLPEELQEGDFKMCGVFTLTDGPYCCAVQTSVKVRNCGRNVYIYYMTPSEMPGSAALCTKKPEEKIPHEYLVEPPKGPEIPIIPLEEVTDAQMEGIVTMEFKFPKEDLENSFAEAFHEKFKVMLIEELNKIHTSSDVAAEEEPETTEESKEETVVVKEGDEVGGDRVEADGDAQAGPVVPDGDTEADIKAPSDVGRSKRQAEEPEVEGTAGEEGAEEEAAGEETGGDAAGEEEPAAGETASEEAGAEEPAAEDTGAKEVDAEEGKEGEHKHEEEDVYYIADTPRVQDGKLQISVLVKEGEDGAVPHENVIQALKTLNETGRLAEIKLSSGEKERRRRRATGQNSDGLELTGLYEGLPQDLAEKRAEYHDEGIWESHKGLFITIIVLAIVCLIMIIIGIMCLKSRDNEWRQTPADEEAMESGRKRPLKGGIESPIADEEIVRAEAPMVERQNPAVANGSGGHISKKEQDNGWVVPIDQLTKKEKSKPEVEDTKL